MIELRNVNKSFGSQQVLSGLDMYVERGTSFAIMGPSGTGKSVLLKHIIGLLVPDSGTVNVDGRSVPDLNMIELQELRREMGYLFQFGALINWLDIFDNIALPLRETTSMDEEQIEERVAEVLEMVHLQDTSHKLPSEISGGMQKRVGLARALVTRPSIILYDEPEAGLDQGMSIAISELIRRLQNEHGMTSLIVTHSPECASIAADQLAIFDGGKFVAQGKPADILNSDHPRVRSFLGQRRT